MVVKKLSKFFSSDKKINQKKTLIILSVIISLFIGAFIIYNLTINKNQTQLKIVGEKVIKHEVNTNYKDLGFDTLNNNEDLKKYVIVSSNVDYKKIGVYEVKYELKYENIHEIITRKVEVVDTTAPVMSINDFNEESNTMYVCPNTKPTLQSIGLKVIDNFDGDLTSKTNISFSNDSINIQVKDSSENVLIKDIKVVKEDKTAPTIELKGDYITLNSTGANFVDPGYSISDNCDNNKDLKVTVTNHVDTSKPGKYDVIYKVMDSNQNINTITRVVEVIKLDPKNKVIYLTFDDGPSAHTKKLLDVLRKYNVKATFFVVNTKPEYDFNIKQAYLDGHSVALHTYSHRYNKIYANEDAYFNDLFKISNKVKDLTGHESKIIRFPGGGSNMISRDFNKGIMTRLSKEVGKRGYRYYDWNVDSMDTQVRNHRKIARNIINGLKDNKPNIVLQHDLYEYSVDAVERVIIHGLKNGYTFLPITDSTPEMHHGLNN